MSVDDSGLDGLFRSGTYTEESGIKPEIFPDYVDVTIPPNIAPLNFKLKELALRPVPFSNVARRN